MTTNFPLILLDFPDIDGIAQESLKQRKGTKKKSKDQKNIQYPFIQMNKKMNVCPVDVHKYSDTVCVCVSVNIVSGNRKVKNEIKEKQM